jgi:hypothetical protein
VSVSDDDQLLAELAEAVRAADEVPAGFVGAGRAAFSWRDVDAELAALAHDSATSATTAGTRAEPAVVRSLSFVAREVSIEVEVTADGLVGQVVPPRPGVIELQGADGSAHAVPVDEAGWFVIRRVTRAMFRLRLHTDADTTVVVTQWVTL